MAFANDSLFMFLEKRFGTRGVHHICRFEVDRFALEAAVIPEWASESPHLWKESVIAGNCRGEMAAFRATDGEPQWNLSLKGCIRSIGSSGSMLFAGVQEGTVYAYELPSIQ